MTPRQIRDGNGELWIVWQVTPALRDRRDVDTEPVSISWVRKLAKPDTQRPGYTDGWLAFRSATERRRLTPYPKGWEWMSDAELLALLEQATDSGDLVPGRSADGVS